MESPFQDLPIRTSRLVLRAPELSDAEALFSIFSNPEVMRYWSTQPWQHVQEATARIERDRAALLNGSAVRLLLQPVDGGSVLGAVTLLSFVPSSRRAEVGYILSRQAWGKGLMHEALCGLLSYGFDKLSLRRVEADVDPRNERSAKVLERLGFVREGFLRERWLVGDEVSDTALYGLLAREWSETPREARR
jgi:RimJ/RimL family protein N-acetyltransferase